MKFSMRKKKSRGQTDTFDVHRETLICGHYFAPRALEETASITWENFYYVDQYSKLNF